MIPELNTNTYDREYCALVTPYKPDSLEVDSDAFRKLVRYFTTDADFLKVRGALIVNPEAGEIFYLTPEERKGLIKVVLEERPAGMPIFAGCYGVRRDEIVDSAVQAKSLGVDGIFVLPPAGTMEVTTSLDGSKNPEVWTDHVRVIAEATQLPLIVHPSHPHTQAWGRALPGESVKMVLEQVPSVVGWKMIYGDAGAHFRVARLIRSLPRHVGILNAPFLCQHTAVICNLSDGRVQGAYNYQKEGLVEHTLAWNSGDMNKVQRVWNTRVMPISDYITSDKSRQHIRYKVATWIRGLVPHPFMRPPMPPTRREEVDSLFKILKNAGYPCIDQAEIDETFSRKDKVLRSIG